MNIPYLLVVAILLIATAECQTTINLGGIYYLTTATGASDSTGLSRKVCTSKYLFTITHSLQWVDGIDSNDGSHQQYQRWCTLQYRH